MSHSGDMHARMLNHAVDAVSAGAIFGSIVGALPPIAAFVAIVWYAIQIYESHTVQKYARARRISRLRKRRERKHGPSVPGTVL